MKYKALFLDFYGTLVAEDDDPVAQVVRAIAEASPVTSDTGQIGRDWFAEYQRLCEEAHGEAFKTQRTINIESLKYMVNKYRAPLDVDRLAQGQFSYWQAPLPFEDGVWLVEHIKMPVCIVSNIDTGDLMSALDSVGWQFEHILTSESCRSYKPRPELFEAALEKLGCSPAEVLHVGDSFTNDVVGAHGLSIDTAWVNRTGKPLPANGLTPAYTVSNLKELVQTIGYGA